MTSSNCTKTFAYLDSKEFQATFSHIIVVVSFPINIFGAYCIARKTPRRFKAVKWFLFHLHCWVTFTDIIVTGCITPYCFFPLLAGLDCGLFSVLHVPLPVQLFSAHVCLAGLATSIVMIFENRHNSIVRGRFKFEHQWLRNFFYFINAFYSLAFLLPLYFNFPDSVWAKKELLKKLPCPHPDFYLDDVFVLAINISTITTSTIFFLFFVVFETLFFCFHSLFYLVNIQFYMSTNTRKLQRKFFFDMLVQVSVPIFVIVVPMIYCCFIVFFEFYSQMGNNLAIMCIALHGISSTITSIILNPPYRHFIHRLVSGKNASTNQRINAPISMAPPTFTVVNF